MQYLAVVDRKEIIFVDSQYKRWVEVARHRFRPQAREALDEPVAYEAMFYTPEGAIPSGASRPSFTRPGCCSIRAGRRRVPPISCR